MANHGILARSPLHTFHMFYIFLPAQMNYCATLTKTVERVIQSPFLSVSNFSLRREIK